MASNGAHNGEKYLPPRVLQVIGLIIFIGAVIFWAITGRESALLMSAAMSLILLGAYRNALSTLRRNTGGIDNGDKK